jgi:hypothetical protein
MEIKKILRVDSPVHLYKMIDDNISLFDGCDGDISIRIRYFVDLGANYLYGCKCEEDSNWESLKREYSVITGDNIFISTLCGVFGCDSINFSEDF